MNRIKYVINKEEGAVTAIMTNCTFDVEREVTKKFKGKLLNTCFRLINMNKLFLPKTISATTRVHGEDVFDESLGKEIARKKLLRKYYSLKAKVLKNFFLDTKEVYLFASDLYSKEQEISASYNKEWKELDN